MSSAAFFASLLALVATSKPPEWTLNATITGPMTPAAERGLEVTIESTAEPQIHARDVLKGGSSISDVPCLSPWAPGIKTSCLLPPGATLTSIDISGSCGGCTTPCAPPPGAYANVTTADAAVWTDVVTARKRVSLPDHPKDFISTRFVVKVSGARFIASSFTATAAGGATPLMQEKEPCAPERRPATTAASCYFSILDSAVSPKTDVDVVVEVTGWGSCPGAKDKACAPPGTLKLDSFEIVN